MAAGLINQTVGDGTGGTIKAKMLSDTGAAGGNLQPATVLYDTSGNAIDFTAASPVTQSGTWTVGISASQTVGIAAGNAVVGQVKPAGRSYETVAASQTDQAMGATGAAGDVLDGILIVPGTTAAGAVSIKDGAGSAITIFAGGGTTALTTLIPFFVPIGATSAAGAWKVTTGANVTAIGVGSFT